ncbi:MAG TPA: DUF4115 domain-containing protein, partial [Aliiroseovarius sp.]|nr:DUF4115 domain-containing protein [Aliiroseovarius sp.]
DRLYRPEALEVPVLVARDAPISTLDPREVGALADLERNAPVLDIDAGEPAAAQLVAAVDSAAEAVQHARTVQVFGADAPEVVLFAVRPSWVRVQAADGSIILEKIMEAGEKYVLPAMEVPPVLRTGNAGSVYFAVNGTAFGPAGTGASIAKNVELSAEALAENFAPADLTRDADLATYVAELTSGQ